MTEQSQTDDIIQQILKAVTEDPAEYGQADMVPEDDLVDMLGDVPLHLRAAYNLLTRLNQEFHNVPQEKRQKAYNEIYCLGYLLNNALFKHYPKLEDYQGFAIGQRWEVLGVKQLSVEDIFDSVYAAALPSSAIN